MPLVRYPCGLIKRSTRSYRSDEDVAAAAGRHQTNIWNMTELNQTAAHENGTRWNQTLAQTSAGWNWTVQGGTEEEEDMERNFTEVYLPSWLNFSDTDEAVGQRIIGGSFCYLGDCPWQVERHLLLQNWFTSNAHSCVCCQVACPASCLGDCGFF